MDGQDHVRFERIGSAAIIRLDRPRALNSLTLPMVRAMKAALAEYAADETVSCVVLAGEGERGLCAGGDVRALHDLGRRGDPEATRFWREEFPLNALIPRYPKPYVVLMDGITMGGGVGVSAHGSVRIVTERTRLAMPETGIGYVPDVGATWLLPRAPGEAGTWMGLTGNAVGAADAIHAGFADLHVPSARLGDVVAALAALPADAGQDGVFEAAARFAEPVEGGVLAANAELIDRVFRFDSVEEIVSALAAEPGPFAAETLATIRGRSPTSLKLTLKLLRLGRASASLEECLDREFSAAVHLLMQHDFYEGVRAALIDRDRAPKWSPATLDAVSEAAVDAYLAGGETLFPQGG